MLSMLYALYTLPVLALAGHSLWEVKLKASTLLPDERVFTTDEQSVLWPDTTISYCFENKKAKSLLQKPGVQGMKLWYDAGLPESRFKWVEASSKFCKKHRTDVLLIVYSDAKVLDTLLGKVFASANVAGPTMTISLAEDIGMLDPIANIAHEIGHAWG